MICLKQGTRMVQTLNNKKEHLFTLYNNTLNKRIEINYIGAKLLFLLNKGRLDSDKIMKLSFIKELIDLGFIIDSSEYENSTILKKCSERYPLTALTLELTNQCNLNCLHCYGSYGSEQSKQYMSFDWIKSNLSEFNKLHVLKIALTGGEVTLHPKFCEIVQLLLHNGFDLTIFTNGYNIDIIRKMLNETRNYYFTIKISCDGPESVHNSIRKNSKSYAHVISLLDLLTSFPNVKTYISTVVMPKNIGYIKDFHNWINRNYPDFIHTMDLVFPYGNGKDNCFNLSDLDWVKREIPELFRYTESQHSRVRCTGGITQCTVSPIGDIKICNAACSRKFLFKFIAFDKSLSYSWKHCGKTISGYRKEKFKHTNDCKKCNLQKKCKMIDCRVMADLYKNSTQCSNPITCIAAKEYFKGK